MLVTGAGGFIGGHVARALLQRGLAVRAVDVKPLEAWQPLHGAADNRVLDCAEPGGCREAVSGCSRVYSFAAAMGGKPQGSRDSVVDVHEAARLLAVPPDVDLVAAARFRDRDLAADGGRRFLAAAMPMSWSRSTGGSAWSRASPGYTCGAATSPRRRRAFARATATAP